MAPCAVSHPSGDSMRLRVMSQPCRASFWSCFLQQAATGVSCLCLAKGACLAGVRSMLRYRSVSPSRLFSLRSCDGLGAGIPVSVPGIDRVSPGCSQLLIPSSSGPPVAVGGAGANVMVTVLIQRLSTGCGSQSVCSAVRV